MSEEEINIAIAESLGWKECQHCIVHGYKTWRYPTDNGCADALPNYTTDLNAMREAKNALTNKQKRKWGEIAVNITPKQDVVLYCKNSVSGENIFTLANLDAKQEAEIYLRTIGKWKGGEQ